MDYFYEKLEQLDKGATVERLRQLLPSQFRRRLDALLAEAEAEQLRLRSGHSFEAPMSLKKSRNYRRHAEYVNILRLMRREDSRQ